MPAQYPFIDVAVNDKIRPRLSRGEALMVFSPKLERVLWTNGAGARFFGSASIYDFLEEGPNRSDVTFRQIEAAARQLAKTGDSRNLMLRITSGFQKVPVTAVAELVEIRRGEPVVLVAIPPIGKPASLVELAQELMAGFDDPDTHMAVFDGDGQVVASSGQFAALGITAHTARTLVKLTSGESDRLVKRPIPTGRGYLPAAIGKISDAPALHLLFAVETILGQMDPSADFAEPASLTDVGQAEAVQTEAVQATVVEETAAVEVEAPEPATAEPAIAVLAVEVTVSALDVTGEPAADRAVAITEDVVNQDLANAATFEPVDAAPFVDADRPAEEIATDFATDLAEEAARAEAIDALPPATDTGGFASAPFDSVIAAIGTIEEIEVSAEQIEADALGPIEEFGAEPANDQPVADDPAGAETAVAQPANDEAADEQLADDGVTGEGVTGELVSAEAAADAIAPIDEIDVQAEIGSVDVVEAEEPAQATDTDLAASASADTANGDDASREEAAFAEAVETAEHSGVRAPVGDAFMPAPADLPGEPIAIDSLPAGSLQADSLPAQQSDDDSVADDSVSDDRAFVFSRDRRASRFVWKIDAEGRFSEVSGEFAEAVGPHAADINGVAFSDLAALFNLDPDGKIGELLKKRDTWSGKTIYWPAEGTSLMVPVDLAALPTYTRNRDFDGFRGFGIVRVGDAVEDPHATGLTFVPQAPEAAVLQDEPAVFAGAAPETVVEEDEDEFRAYRFADETPELLDAQAEALDEAPEEFGEAEAAETAVEDLAELGVENGEMDIVVAASDDSQSEPADGPETDNDAAEPIADDVDPKDQTNDQTRPLSLIPSTPFRSVEPPVLRIMEPVRPVVRPEKIVQLEEHRNRSREGLTPGEQAAFREIARKLDPMGLRAKVEESLGESLQAKTSESAPAPVTSETPAATPPDMPEASSTPADQFDAPRIEREQPAAPLLEGLPLKKEKSLTAEIVDLMPVALLVHVGDRLIHANPEFFSLTGYTSLEELEQSGGLDALIQRQDLDASGDQAGRVVAVRADDTLAPVTARLQSVRFEDASALMLALIVQPEATRPAPVQAPPEMTAAQAGEAARLRVEVEEMRSILETATDGVVILDADGDIRSMNRAASALFNFDDLETRGKPFVMLFAHESQKSILDYLSGLAGHGVASVLNDGREVIGREASGGFLPLFMTIGKLTSSNGFCVVIRDITQWKRTEEELRNAKRAAETANAHKTDFLARVSHEIRTPLNAIIGFADMMANEHFGPVGHPRYGEYAHDIVRSGRHVLDIVNDLLDISKIEAGEMDLDFAAVGLNETVQAAVSIIQPQANSQRVIIRTALSQAVPSVVADSRSIKQIVLNILANAIRFTPSGGQIIVSTAYEANGSVALRIRDTGIGMSRTELEQAMKPFRQVSTGSPRNRGDGTGLGLPLTKAMVDANRASFAISSAPNEGTLVEVSFPSPRVLAD
ncbi:Sensor histidine kinase RcsC [Rhizobium sp. CECT 9324]|nr:Sensor histidine kinase RcsC [Rhizobium sp. CECT 9324]